MKVTQVKVRVGVTRKTKVPYEFIRLDEEMAMDLVEGESPTEVINKARDFLLVKVNADIEQLLK